MKRPNDKQIENVLAGIATSEDARLVAQWFATKEGSAYLSASMDKNREEIKLGLEDLYVDHEIPSTKILALVEHRIRRMRIRRVLFRVAAVLIPFLLVATIFIELNSRVDLFGGTEYEEIYVAKGERIQMMFQDGTRVYINSDSRLKYPKKFGYFSREVSLQGEAYFVVVKNTNRPFVVNLNEASIQVTGTSFNVDAYPESTMIHVCLDEGAVNLMLPSEKKYLLAPGEQLAYDRKSGRCTILKSADTQYISLWKQNVIAFDDAPLEQVVKELARWYNVTFVVESASATTYSFTLVSENTLLEKTLKDLEKISPVRFEYDDVKKEVRVKMKN